MRRFAELQYGWIGVAPPSETRVDRSDLAPDRLLALDPWRDLRLTVRAKNVVESIPPSVLRKIREEIDG